MAECVDCACAQPHKSLPPALTLSGFRPLRHQFGRVGAGQRSNGCAVLWLYTGALYQNPLMHKTQAVRALRRPLPPSGEPCN